MIRVVHLFNVRKSVEESAFVEWLEAQLSSATRMHGCIERKTWILLDGFEGSYRRPRGVKNRPKYVIEAYWSDQQAANRFREWLTETPEGRALHERWFSSVTDHTTLRYVEGWLPVPADA
ncbi:MAG: hypothetical protein WD766_04180 [Gemmatimonadota bacterium]